MTHSCSNFHHLIRQIAPGVLQLNGLDVNIDVAAVLVVENRTSAVMGYVEPICKKVMIDILSCFLQRDDMPLACDLLVEGIFFSATGPWVPVVDAEPLLHRLTIA